MNEAHEVVRLRARVRELEKALVERSREVAKLQALLDPRGLIVASRLMCGEVVTGAAVYYDLSWWRGGTDLIERDVLPTLETLWLTAPGRLTEEP